MSKPSLEEMIKYLEKKETSIITEWRERGQTIDEAAKEYEMLRAINDALGELDEIYESMKRHMVKRGYVKPPLTL